VDNADDQGSTTPKDRWARKGDADAYTERRNILCGMTIRLPDLLKRVSPDVKATVQRVRDQARPILREALRAECRLVMRTADESDQGSPGAQVPVELDAAWPVALAEIAFPDNYERIMLVGRYRNYLEQVRHGTRNLRPLLEELLRIGEPDGPRDSDAASTARTIIDLSAVQQWAERLLTLLEENDPLKKMLIVNEDFLGVYEYKIPFSNSPFEANHAKICLYWCVIGLVSEWLGCSIENLTVVVLTHELAHAYTQLGADIDGRRWPALSFARAEMELKEGLAQYYTDRVLRRLEHRYSGALEAFFAMLSYQPAAYKTHIPRVLEKVSPEAIRRAMLEIRRWNEGTLAQFNERLKAAQTDAGPRG
jgi:hypothetical protein